MHFFFIRFSFHFHFSGLGHSLVLQLPIIKQLPVKVQMVVSAVVQLLCLFLIYHLYRSSFLLLMDELTQALTQFYPTSGGLSMNGGFNPPPVPENSCILAAASHEAEGQPGSSHLAPYQDQGEKKLLSVIERHLQKHCVSPEIQTQFPDVVDWKQEDFQYFAKKLAISELDIDRKSDFQMEDLANYLKENPRKWKLLLSQALEKHFKE